MRFVSESRVDFGQSEAIDRLSVGSAQSALPTAQNLDAGLLAPGGDQGDGLASGLDRADVAAPAGLSAGRAFTFSLTNPNAFSITASPEAIAAAVMSKAEADMNGGSLSALDGHLAALYYQHTSQSNAMGSFISTTSQLDGALKTINGTQMVSIEAISKDGDGAALLHQLEALGFQGSSFGGNAGGLLPVNELAAMLKIGDLGHAVESATMTNTGSVDTQADQTMLATAARAGNFGLDGTGLKIGVISGSFDTDPNASTRAATDQQTGDLPDSSHMIVLHDQAGDDEGRGMSQLVHDLAPGATIYFADDGTSPEDMANSILDLAAAGCKVIVDDVVFLNEPAYQDGVISQAIAKVEAEGVAYFTSAGNYGRNGFESGWTDSGALRAVGAITEHLAKLTTGSHPQFLPVVIPAGASVSFILQWDQPSASATPGGHGSANDLDLFVLDQNGNQVLAQDTSNQVGGDPNVSVQYTNQTGADQTVEVEVGLHSGVTPGDIRIIALKGGGGQLNIGPSALNQNSGSMFGHGTSSAISVGAVPYWSTPFSTLAGINVDSGPNLEVFSSAGTGKILFDTAGHRLTTPIIHQGPDFSAVDGGDTTFFGSDDGIDGDGAPNFYGTSAAAPDAAATAILMLEANPDLTISDLRNLMGDSAWDIRARLEGQDGNLATTSLPNGYDADSGEGLINANAAVGFATTLTITPTPYQARFLGTHLNDTFVFDTQLPGNALTPGWTTHLLASDKIDGGNGADIVKLNGDYLTTPLVFGATTMVNVETLNLSAGHSYALIMNDVNVAAGARLLVDGSALGAGNSLVFTGSAETNGRFEILGGSGADALRGGHGSDTINGGAGADQMVGNDGDDIYVVDNAADKVTEAANQGSDTVFASVSYVLQAGQSVELLATALQAGTTAINLTGNEQQQILHGNNGNNILDGGASSDTMFGYGGNDVYHVDALNDQTIEAPGQGTDTVYASVTYFLTGGQSIEVLSTSSAAGTTAINLTGNEQDQTINGNAGNNAINGGAGVDTLLGFGGNDSYVVDNVGDKVFETAGNGTDTVFASVSYVLGAGQSVEVMGTTLAGGTTAINLTGNEQAQTINGNAGVNTLAGGAGNDALNGFDGNDRLIGGAGRDTLNPGNGSDTLVYASASESTGVGRDLIVGMNITGTDRFDLPVTVTSIGAAITHGALSTATFDANLAAVVNATHLAAHQAVLFTPDSGDLDIAGHVFLVVDANGVAGYQAGQDYVFELQNLSGTLTINDFA